MKKSIMPKELGINLNGNSEKELFKWFLACLLFGKPIQQEVAKRTFLLFESRGFLSPEKILAAGWDRLVEALDEGHYVRYDFSTATKLLEICKKLKAEYGSITALIKSAKSRKELEKKLLDFKGIGPVTAGIFLMGLKRC